jgi:hypothetical protein
MPRSSALKDRQAPQPALQSHRQTCSPGVRASTFRGDSAEEADPEAVAEVGVDLLAGIAVPFPGVEGVPVELVAS